MAITLLESMAMLWSDLLGALSFQIPTFSLEDFNKLNPLESSKDVKEYFNLENDWLKDSESILKQLKNKNIKWVSPNSADFPKRFQWMKNSPVFLTYVGEISCVERPILSVVGSREPSLQGKEFLSQELGIVLQQIPLTIVSGAARGIDQAAHACALRNKCPTVAVMPSGITSPYPRDFISWFKPILELGGCIMSEYLPKTFMHRHHFHRRNQLIVGLSPAILVIEAKRKSGTMMTARHAQDNHCDVGVVPGFALDPKYGGSLDLFFAGEAELIRDHLDILNLIANAGDRQLP